MLENEQNIEITGNDPPSLGEPFILTNPVLDQIIPITFPVTAPDSVAKSQPIYKELALNDLETIPNSTQTPQVNSPIVFAATTVPAHIPPTVTSTSTSTSTTTTTNTNINTNTKMTEQQKKQIQFINELKYSQFKKSGVSDSELADNVSLISSNLSVVSSINLDTHLQDDDEVENLKNKRNKSELEFTMGYGQDEIEIELDPDTLELISRPNYKGVKSSLDMTDHSKQPKRIIPDGIHLDITPIKKNNNNNINNNIDNNNNNNFHPVNISESYDIGYDSLDISYDLRNGNGNGNGNTEYESFKTKLKNYECAGPYFRMLRDNGAYRYLFFSSLISLLGDWFNELACLSLLTRFGASGLMVSVFLVLRECPSFFFSPVTGVVSDRFDRRNVMLATDILRMLIVPLFLLVRSSDTLWLLYVLAFLQFTIGSFFMPAKTAMLPMLVKKEDIITANAIDQATYSSMMLLGASIGGFVSYKLGTDANYMIDSATYLGSCIFVLQLIRLRAGVPSKAHNKQDDKQADKLLEEDEVNNNLMEDSELDTDIGGSIVNEDRENENENEESDDNVILLTKARDFNVKSKQQKKAGEEVEDMESGDGDGAGADKQEDEGVVAKKQTFISALGDGFVEYFKMYREGLKYLYNNPYILMVACTKSIGAIVWAGVDAVLIRFAETEFRMDENGSLSLGLILACGGLGIFIVPFVIARFIKDIPENHINILRTGLFFNCFATFWLGFSSGTFPLFLACNVFRTTATCVLWLYSSSILQQSVPDHVRGRVFAFEYGMLTIIGVIAKMATGILLDTAHLSPTNITYLFGTIGIFVFVFWNLIIMRYKVDALTVIAKNQASSSAPTS